MTLQQIESIIFSCFPIIPKSDPQYKLPMRQYKDLSEAISHKGKQYHTTIPLMVYIFIADTYGLKDEAINRLEFGESPQEGIAQYDRLYSAYMDISKQILRKNMTRNPNFSDGQKAWVRKAKLVSKKMELTLEKNNFTLYKFK